MGRPSLVVTVSFGAVLAYAGVAVARAAPAQPTAAPDPAATLALMGAPFADAPAPAPTPARTTAMAFLPGRGVVSWDVTGKTPDEAREAEIEAMGAADARAVQREIDAAEGERMAEAPQSSKPTRGLRVEWPGSFARSVAPPVAGLNRAGGVIPLSRAARMQAALGVRSGGELKERPRVYAFAAVSGQGMGINMTHDEAGWKTAGLTTDGGGFTGQRQAGFAWRTGGAQTSLSYVQQKTDTQILGLQKIKDHRVMLTATLQPKALVRFFTGRR